MVPALDLVQFLYETSMTVGSSLDLHKMLRRSLSTILRKIGCSAGGIHLLREDSENTFYFEQVFSIPKDTSVIDEYQAALASIPTQSIGSRLAEFQDQLPIMKPITPESSCTIMELPGFGLMVLIKHGPQLDPVIVKAMAPICDKLADACLSCLQNDELIRHRLHLEKMVAEKSAELLQKNAQLKEEIEHVTQMEEENSRLIQKLQEALLNVKTLSGMLPICSQCKNIRDDKGYWNEIETYIQKHSETLFSHSLCPDCAEDLYGNEEWFKDVKEDKQS